MTAAEITALLRRQRLPVSRETLLQLALETCLADAGIEFEREARLAPGERIDFLCAGGVGIEAKTRYGKRAIYRQLQRYAEREQVTALILVTGTAVGLPESINGKPVYFVSIGRGML